MKTTWSLFVAAVVGVVAWRADWCQAQYTSYGDYYRKNIGNRSAVDPGTNRYLYDKYFYHNPAISPYSSAIRGGSAYGPAWQTSVRPELERREAAERAQRNYIQQRKLQGNVGHTVYPGANFVGATPADALLKPIQKRPQTPLPYYKQVYGGGLGR